MRKATGRILGTILFLGTFFVVVKMVPLKAWLEPLWNLVETSGGWGYGLFLVSGVLLSLLLVPVSLIIVAGGLLFGFWKGLALTCAILVLSTTISFFAGDVIWARVKGRPSFQSRWFDAVRQAIEHEGVYLVALLRLTPFIHFTIGNLFFGSLALDFWKYTLASIVGMMPGTMLLVYAGELARQSVGQEVNLNGWHTGLFIFGLLVFVGISILVTHRTRRILKLPG